MPSKPKPKKVGRPKMAKGEAKGKIVPIRFNAEDIKKVTAAAKANQQTVSEWIRRTLMQSVASKPLV
jgi:predicted HicB family RNase H-like nuclease